MTAVYTVVFTVVFLGVMRLAEEHGSELQLSPCMPANNNNNHYLNAPFTMADPSFPSLTGFPLMYYKWSVGFVRSRRFTMPVIEGDLNVLLSEGADR